MMHGTMNIKYYPQSDFTRPVASDIKLYVHSNTNFCPLALFYRLNELYFIILSCVLFPSSLFAFVICHICVLLLILQLVIRLLSQCTSKKWN